MKPQPIVQYWHDEQIPDYVAELGETFRRHNPEMEHFVFSERTAAELIGERFGSRELAAFRSCAVPAMQADYFRYCAVHALGGVYSDTDFRCEGNLESLVRSGCTVFQRDSGAVINGFFAFPQPDHPLLRLAIDIATTNIEARVAESVWGVTGPAIFSSLTALQRQGSFESFLEFARAKAIGFSLAGKRMWDPELLCETTGSYSRVDEAFHGLRVVPFAEAETWISKHSVRAPYKATPAHYLHHEGSIFRKPGEAA